MAGRPGRSGGHNRLSAEEHALRGTWRRDRHGALPLKPSLAVIAGRALAARAEFLEAAGHRLVQAATRSKLVPAKFAAGLQLLAAANEVWIRLEEDFPAPEKPSPDTLDAFRRRRHPNGT